MTAPASAAVRREIAERRARRASGTDGEWAPARNLWIVVPGMLALAAVAGFSILAGAWAPFAVVGVAGLVAWMWRRPVVAAVVVAAVVPALSGLGRGGVIPGLKVSELLLVLCAAVIMLRRPATWRPWTAVDVALTVFAVVGAVVALFHGLSGRGLEFESLLRSGLLPTFLLLTWWTASRAVADAEDLRRVLRWVLLVSLVPAVVGVLQYFDVLGVREAIIALVGDGVMPRPGESDARITGPFPIAHSFGGYLLPPVVLAFVLMVTGDRGVLPGPVLAVVLAIDLAAVVLAVTVTLVLWVPVAVLTAAWLVRRLGWALGLLTLATVAAVLLFPGAIESRVEAQTNPAAGTQEGLVPQTLQYRILVWQRDYLPLVGQAWPVGLGIDEPDTVQFSSTENQYLTFLLRGGVGLLAAAVAAFVALGVQAWRRARTSTGLERSAAATVAAVLVFLPAAAMVWPYVTNAGLPQALLGFAGAALALRRPSPAVLAQPRWGPRQAVMAGRG